MPFSGKSGKSAATVKGYIAVRANPREDTTRTVSAVTTFAPWDSPCGQDDSSPPTIRVDSERVCVVDEDFARYYWPNASAIGQRLWDGSEAGKDAEAFTVVGVVGEVKQAGLTEDEAQGAIYYPYAFRHR